MATVEDVVTLVLAATDVNADRPIPVHTVEKWVNQRYKQLCARVRFRARRKFGTLTVPAAISTGSVAVTRGSDTIVADADAQAVLSAAVVGRHIRVSTVWYRITAYLAPNITIETEYTEQSQPFTSPPAPATPDTDGAGYTIIARRLSLAADARWLGKFVHQRGRTALGQRSLHAMDWTAPDRVLASGGPWYWAEAGHDSSGNLQVELYPGTTTSETVNYVYWTHPPDLTLTSTVPDTIDPYVLREGALIDLYRYRASQELNQGRQDIAGFWRNESRAQVTSWEREIMEATRADRGVDDITMMMHVLGHEIGGARGDIYDARTELLARGNRP